MRLLGLILMLTACQPSKQASVKERTSIPIEKRADGLVYAPGMGVPLSGEVLTFNANTICLAVESYEKGKPDGVWKRFWNNGKLKREQEWVAGSQIRQRSWYEDGTLKEDIAMKDGAAFGQLQMWWPNGNLRRTAFVGPDHLPHGNSLEYAEDGKVIVDAIFQHGQYTGGLLQEVSLALQATGKAD